jgi:hypothetical protein
MATLLTSDLLSIEQTIKKFILAFYMKESTQADLEIIENLSDVVSVKNFISNEMFKYTRY